MNQKKYKFAFNYNNVIKYLDFPSGTEIGMLKWNLISHLPKGIKQSNPVFTYKGKLFTDNEYDIIDSIFKEGETNEILCEHLSNQSQLGQANIPMSMPIPSSTANKSNKADIIINSQSIITSLNAVEASSYFKFFTNYQKELIAPIDQSFLQMKKDIEKTLEDFILKSKKSLIEYINIKEFENIQDGISVIKANLGKILKDSNTIENLFNVYDESMLEYKRITAMTKELSQRYSDLLFIHHSINESIAHLVQSTKAFTQCYDYRTFIPYATVISGDNMIDSNAQGQGQDVNPIQDILSKGFSFENFIKSKGNNSKDNDNSNDPNINPSIQSSVLSSSSLSVSSTYSIKSLSTTNQSKPIITEQDLKYAEQLNINTFIEKVEEITFLRVERISKIKKRFESISEDIKKVQDKIISHFSKPEEEQTHLASVTQKIKEANSLLSAKMTFEERKMKEAILSELIKEIRVLDKKIKMKYDEIVFDNKIIDIILNTSTRDFMSHINTKYDCITDLNKIKKIFDFNSLIIASNSKVELWKGLIDFRNENVSDIGIGMGDSVHSNILPISNTNAYCAINVNNDQLTELLTLMPNKLNDLTQTIDSYNKLTTDSLKKIINDNRLLLNQIQINTQSINTILNNTNSIPGIISSSSLCSSAILTKRSEIDWLISLFPKETKYRLVYQASRDGCLTEDFHRKCDGINDNIVIIETVNGFKFGGFTSKSWALAKTKGNGEDNKAFIMSITLKKRYEIGNKKLAVYSSKEHLCCFGDEIAVMSNCLNRNDNYNMAPEQYLIGEGGDGSEGESIVIPVNDYLAGEKMFMVKEMEVFHVITKENCDYDLNVGYKGY